MRQESFLTSIGSSVFWQGLGKLAGLAKHIIIAAAFGLSAQLDVFYMAVALLGVLVFSWGDMVNIVAIPNMIHARQEGHHEKFRQIASGLFSLTLLGSLLLALLVYFFQDAFAWFARGFEPERRQLLVDATHWLLPVILLTLPYKLMSGVLQAIRQFSPPNTADFLTTLIILICVALFKEQGNVLIWSLGAGTAGAFLYLLVKAWRFVLPLGNPFSLAVRQSLLLAPGLLVLQAANSIYTLTDRVFVSFLPKGEISALAYAVTLVSLLPALISFSGFFTVVAEQRDQSQRAEKLNDLLSIAIYFALGAICFTLIANTAMIQALLERGLFTSTDTQRVSAAVMAYVWVLLPSFLMVPLSHILQVERQIGLMVWRTVLGMVTNVILNAWFLFGLGWGLFGVALATSISYWVMLLTALHSLKRVGYHIDWQRHLKWGLWVGAFLTLIYAGFTFIPMPFTGDLPILIASALLIAGTLLVAGLLYPGDENRLVRKTLKRCLPMRLKQITCR